MNEEEAAHADVDEPDIEIITEYYSNDNLRLKGYKEDGEYWGVFTEWYENGSIKFGTKMVSLKRNGTLKIIKKMDHTINGIIMVLGKIKVITKKV